MHTEIQNGPERIIENRLSAIRRRMQLNLLLSRLVRFGFWGLVVCWVPANHKSIYAITDSHQFSRSNSHRHRVRRSDLPLSVAKCRSFRSGAQRRQALKFEGTSQHRPCSYPTREYR